MSEESTSAAGSLRGAAASRRWALALGALAALVAVLIGSRLVAEKLEFGVADLVEAMDLVLAVGLLGLAVSLHRAAVREAARFDAAPLAARGGFLRTVLVALAVGFGIVAFSTDIGIVGRWLAHELSILLVVALLLRLAPRVDAPLQRLARMPGVGVLDAVAFNLLVMLVLLEGGLRIWLAVSDPPPWLSFRRDAFTYKLQPSGRADRPPNRQGYFDLDFEQTRIPGVRRVVVLGDSFCAGHVSYEENWLTLADRLLGKGVEVYNLGIHNTSPREYLEVFEREGLSYQPDLVAVSFYVGNDVSFGYVEPHPLYKEGIRSYHVMMRVVVLVREMLREGSTVDEVLVGEKAGEDPGAAAGRFKMSHDHYLRQQRRHLEMCSVENDVEEERKWRASLGALDRIADLCRERGVPFVLIVAPDAFQTDPGVLAATLAGIPEARDGRYPAWRDVDFDLDAPQRRLASFARERGIPFLDLTSAFAAAREHGEGPFFLERNNHWNPSGNRVAATALVEFLEPMLGAPAT